MLGRRIGYGSENLAPWNCNSSTRLKYGPTA
jgi:hypothetical protein